jgi:hypothetical protein
VIPRLPHIHAEGRLFEIHQVLHVVCAVVVIANDRLVLSQILQPVVFFPILIQFRLGRVIEVHKVGLRLVQNVLLLRAWGRVQRPHLRVVNRNSLLNCLLLGSPVHLCLPELAVFFANLTLSPVGIYQRLAVILSILSLVLPAHLLHFPECLNLLGTALSSVYELDAALVRILDHLESLLAERRGACLDMRVSLACVEDKLDFGI